MAYQAFLLILILLFAVVIHGEFIPNTIHSFVAFSFPLGQSAERGIVASANLRAHLMNQVALLIGETIGETFYQIERFEGERVRQFGFIAAAGSVNFLSAAESLRNFFSPAIKSDLPPEISKQGGDSSVLVTETEPTYLATVPAHQGSCDGKTLSAIKAHSFLLHNLDRNLVVASRHPSDRWPMASLTKLMTSLAAIQSMDLNFRITVSPRAAALEGDAGNIDAGDVFSLHDLIQAMLISSSNRAALAIAEVNGENAFVDRMQRTARELGMKNTAYTEPTGLSFLNQSTAKDLDTLAVYIARYHPELLAISQKTESMITELAKNERRLIRTVDFFAGARNFLGGKTGFTDEAQKNFIGVFRVNNNVILSIVLGSDNAFKATGELLDCIK